MSRGPCEAAAPERDAEPEEDSLSAISYESDTETKLKKKTSYKLSKSPKSPYSSSTCLHPRKAGLKSSKTAESKHFDNSLVKGSRQLRRGSHKQGAWVDQTKSDLVINRAGSALPSNTPEYLKEALGMKKPKHARSSSSGYIPGTPDYKEKEDMYDEIIELKKKIQVQKCEADRMKTKLRRLEEDNNRKDKQIDQLLESVRSSEFAWARTEPKNDNSSVISGLKQKILRLEQQCKEKDNFINKLQTDVKSTNAEEMRIALQSYYEEIQRLQTLLAKSKTVQRKPPPESQEQKVLSAAVLRLSRSIKELQEENQNLKADLDQTLASSPASSRANHYVEKSKQRPVWRISKLGKKMDENAGLQLSETITSPLLASSPLAQSDHLAAQESNLAEEHEHLRRVVKKLKGQMAVLQNQLAVKEEEIWKLTQNMKELEEQQKTSGRQARLEATEPSDQGQQELHIGAQQFHPTCTFTSRGSDLGPSLPHPPEHQRKEQAAQIIQRRWKAYKTKIEEDALNKSPDSSPGPSSSRMPADCKAEEEAVRLIQSVFRAHITRTQLAGRPLISSPGGEKASPVASSGEKKPVWSIFRRAPLVFTSSVPATSSQNQRQPSPSPPADETYSDDSDDIITVSSSSSVKEKSPFDFSSYLSHSLLRS
ncbi:IQ domain-containing protein E [Tiliqua scincoides]|uniref:IQ domain-containing protein E n=1 Tax=Tiliqua scincoides TaxID=71010 RepID=UPI003462B19D